MIADRDHPNVVSVFEEPEHFDSLGPFKGPLFEVAEGGESCPGERVEAELAKVRRPAAAGVGDRLAREHQGIAALVNDDLDGVVVEHGGRGCAVERGEGVHGQDVGFEFGQGFGDGVDRRRVDEWLVALDVDEGVALVVAHSATRSVPVG